MLLEKIEDLLKEVDNLKAQNAEDVEKLRLKYLSKKGEINAIMADFRNHTYALSHRLGYASSAVDREE